MSDSYPINGWKGLTYAANNYPNGIYQLSSYSTKFLKYIIFLVERICFNGFDLDPPINSAEYKFLVALGMHLDRFEKLYSIPEKMSIIGNTVLIQEELLGFKYSCIHELYSEKRKRKKDFHLYSLDK